VGRVVEGGRRKGERNRREGEKEREREREMCNFYSSNTEF
jgi:hypothetical protein